MSKKILKSKRGFTVIELMIAISLFLVVIMAGMGTLLNANLIYNKSQNIRAIMDNMSFVMDEVSRNLRTGYNYHCITNEATDDMSEDNLNTAKSGAGCKGIAFESTNGEPGESGDQWVYALNNSGQINKSTDSYNTLIPLVPAEVKIDLSLSGFEIVGAEPLSTGDTQQPLVIMHLVGKITYKNIDTPFSLQTSISQRALDNQ